MTTTYWTGEEAARILHRLAGHWKPLVATDEVAADWIRVIRSTRYAPEVADLLVDGWAQNRAPKIADWYELSRQTSERHAREAPMIEGAGCLYCHGTGWIWLAEGEHMTVGNTVTGPRLHEAPPENPILRRCQCGTTPNGPRKAEPPVAAADVVRVRRMIGDLVEKIRDENRLRPKLHPKVHEGDLPGGPPMGEKHMTAEELAAELEAFGDRKVRDRK